MTTQTKSKVSTKISSSSQVSAPKAKITHEHVARYLRTHSDFFMHHLELIETLAIPHETGVAVSLVERQVELLRNRNRELDQKLHQLVTVAKDNEKVSRCLHALTLDLVSMCGYEETLAGIQNFIRADFPDTRVMVRLFETMPKTRVADCEFIGTALQKSKFIQDLFSIRRRGIAFLTKHQINSMFGSENAEPVRSAVAVALKREHRLGVLFLGSADANRFQGGMGTLFLGNLGEMIGAKLQQFALASV